MSPNKGKRIELFHFSKELHHQNCKKFKNYKDFATTEEFEDILMKDDNIKFNFQEILLFLSIKIFFFYDFIIPNDFDTEK